MSASHFTVVTRYGRAALLVIVGALCVVPPLVRATFSGSSSSPIRLNRGFESPPTKGDETTQSEQVADSVPPIVPEPARIDRRVTSIDHPVLHAVHVPAPDAKRGPPSLPSSL